MGRHFPTPKPYQEAIADMILYRHNVYTSIQAAYPCHGRIINHGGRAQTYNKMTMTDIKTLAAGDTDLDRPIIISGPCSAETPEQTLDTAKRLARAGIKFPCRHMETAHEARRI